MRTRQAGGSGYTPPDAPGMGGVVAAFKRRDVQLRDLQTPSGTQVGELVAQVQATLADIDSKVSVAVGITSYTKSQIDARIASTPSDVQVNGTLTVTSSLTVLGPGQVNGGFNSPSGLTSADVRARSVVNNRTTVWVDGDGVIGNSASSIYVKQDFRPAKSGLAEAIYKVGMLRFRYIEDVEKHGDDAAWFTGGVAEYFVEAGLEEWVFTNPDGSPQGINYELLSIPLILAVQDLQKRLKVAESQLADGV